MWDSQQHLHLLIYFQLMVLQLSYAHNPFSFTQLHTFPLWVQVESEVVIWFLGSNKLDFVHQIYR